MKLPPEFVRRLERVDTKKIVEDFQKRFDEREKDIPQKKSTAISIVNEIRPSDLFCYLGGRFGRPNGIQNILREDRSDNIIHWDWTLSYADGLIMFLGMNFRTEIHLLNLNLDDSVKVDLIDQLKADLKNYGSQMTQVRNGLERWTEFVNPYQRVKRSIERLFEYLKQLDLEPSRDKFDPFKAAAEKYKFEDKEKELNRWSELAKKYSEGFGLCFGIRSLLPVLAEAFVNLLLYVLMKPEIKADDRLKEHVFRQPIDVRIRSLPDNCIGFQKRPDYSSDACRAYHSIVNERNDLLHGNVIIDKLKFNQVYFLGTVPIFKEYKTVWERSLEVEANAVGLDAVNSEFATVNSLIEYLLSCLDSDARKHIEIIAKQKELGLNEETGNLGVLFSERFVDISMGRSVNSSND
jgi:hypothetical protein